MSLGGADESSTERSRRVDIGQGENEFQCARDRLFAEIRAISAELPRVGCGVHTERAVRVMGRVPVQACTKQHAVRGPILLQ